MYIQGGRTGLYSGNLRFGQTIQSFFLNRYSLRPSIVWSLLPTHHGDGYDDGEREVPLGVDDLLGDVVEVVPAVVRPQAGVERYGDVAERRGGLGLVRADNVAVVTLGHPAGRRSIA